MNTPLRDRIERAQDRRRATLPIRFVDRRANSHDTRPEWLRRGAARDLTWQVRS